MNKPTAKISKKMCHFEFQRLKALKLAYLDKLLSRRGKLISAC